jgi:Rod binding domain-containing protein
MDVTTNTGIMNTDMPNAPTQDQKLREASEKLESAFLAEMLKAASYGKNPESFGGGQAEDQFASFLIQAQADKMVEAGGIGLAEQLFETLKGRADGAI